MMIFWSSTSALSENTWASEYLARDAAAALETFSNPDRVKPLHC
jgi:hypothetical protein